MTNISKIILVMLIFLIHTANAFDSSWLPGAVRITASSPFQANIDRSFWELFNSPAQRVLCAASRNRVSLSYSLGMSPAMALEISKVCRYEELRPVGGSVPVTKVLAKTYYLSSAENTGLESWTDFGNRTFIFVRPDYTMADLYQVLIHETAIAFDAKNRILYPTYLRYQSRFSHSQSFVEIDNLTDSERLLQEAFNLAATENVANTFAALRAYEFESMVKGDTHRMSHEDCRERFQQIYKHVKKFQGYNNSPESLPDALVNLLAQAIDSHMTSKMDGNAMLKMLLDKELTLQDGDEQVSFCQFMSSPLLSAQSSGSIFASGPRPRLIGGSGGQGGSKMSSGPLKGSSLDDEFRKNLNRSIKFEISVDKNASKSSQRELPEMNNDLRYQLGK